MRVLVCGDRNWTNYSIIRSVLESLPTSTLIIEGEAKGADSIARDIAKMLGMTVIQFPADWTKYGKAAGPIRNRQMLKEGKPDRVIAFHSNISKSKGTADMVRVARQAGIPVEIVTGESF